MAYHGRSISHGHIPTTQQASSPRRRRTDRSYPRLSIGGLMLVLLLATASAIGLLFLIADSAKRLAQ